MREANTILGKMLGRLYASLIQGPCLNCRPHSSRQRLDLNLLQAFKHLNPGEILPELLTGSGKIEVLTKVPKFESSLDDEKLSEGDRAAKRAFEAQSRLVAKLREIAEDARSYEQETGENALYIGYPLISVPPGADVLGESTSRVYAPAALIAVDMTVRKGASPSVILTAKGTGVDLVVANFPLMAWLEQQSGRDGNNLFADEDGKQPWKEINEIIKLLADGLHMGTPGEISAKTILESVPRLDQLSKNPAIINAAILGLFPVSNQGLLRDTTAMAKGEDLVGPVQNFLSTRVESPNGKSSAPPPVAIKRVRRFNEERLVTDADPCQNRAVRLAKDSATLVIHGPPGTGKSQTITNIIGDHLARGERVLLVCDKRTALDVVYHRLEHLGIDNLCAIVHDAQRDQRPLYMKIRDRLETLPEQKSNGSAEIVLRQTDEELQRIHLELSGYFSALSEPTPTAQKSFYDLVGEWFNIESPVGISVEEGYLAEATIAEFDSARLAIHEVLERSYQVDYPKNPWADAAGLDLGEFMSRPVIELRGTLVLLQGKANELDASWTPEQPPLATGDLIAQGIVRGEVAKILTDLAALELYSVQKSWFVKGNEILRQTLAELDALATPLAAISSNPLDIELKSVIGAKPPSLAEINQANESLVQYSEVARKWYGFLSTGKKSAAQKVLSIYGLPVSVQSSDRVQKFFVGLKNRLLCQDFYQRTFTPEKGSSSLLPDGDLVSGLNKYRTLLKTLAELHAKATEDLLPAINEALVGDTKLLAARLNASINRSKVLAAFLSETKAAGMFSPTWLEERDKDWRQGKLATPLFEQLLERFGTVETVLRLGQAYKKIPASLRNALASLIYQSAEADTGLIAFRKALLAKEISSRIRNNPFLQQIDRERMEYCFRRYRELEGKKRLLVLDAIKDLWVGRQKSRLLSSTGTQLNSDGAALKRRLLTRGENAMKLRQMILTGAQGAQPDPLFDMCPVWMASPGTVAQIFPRQQVFDAIIFDEASQCRLEEALPVLTRGRRIVIAGDPKQLPPTRFFEAALTESEIEDAESEQDLFEQQQGETEDLLGAALNIEVQQCYLDVHYRSRNDALIGFSNKNFYQDRLQCIPSPPTNRPQVSPIHLIHVEGIYEKRGNKKEAEIVCDIVAELLGRSAPPSIGVACFNLTQRGVILDALEERCERDSEFAQRLEQARSRQGRGSFEGLFVKNLENVQGDERDHIIISTTFGNDSAGKFRRNFGPLGRAGGGRRLNVLVTRAREMIHLVTSIPRNEYSTLPELSQGQTPNGRWLVYAYIRYAETVNRDFDDENRNRNRVGAKVAPSVQMNSNGPTSLLAVGIANSLVKEYALGSDVPWGSEGFCIDVALRDPDRPGEVTLGVLCDMTKFSHASDPVEWDLFRTGILEGQGWKVHRVWSPVLYSDPERHKRAIAEASKLASGGSANSKAPV